MKDLLVVIIMCCVITGYAQDPVSSVRTTQSTFNPDWAPFYHGVASGDPLEDRVVIWTRITPVSMDPQMSIEVDWRVAEDPQLENTVREGTFTTDATRDYTVKVDVDGLEAGETYYYGFAHNGKNSLTGRTKTTPTGDQSEQLKFAVVSCSNYQAGYFNAYRRIAERNDLDAVIHLGDYIYEYEQGGYGLDSFFAKRPLDPETEILSVDDYRTRYSLYRLDSMLARAHQQHPFITVWDDHESANDAWKGGAENHNEIIGLDTIFDGGEIIGLDTIYADEGPWDERLAIAKQVYFEWLPVRENSDLSVYRKISYGELVDLIMLDTRIEGREEQILNIYDPALQSPDRTILGSEQKQWLKDQLSSSSAKWKLIGQQVTFSEFNIGWAGPANGAPFEAAEALFLDFWDGYPAERTEIINFISENEIDNVVVLTGDVHASFMYDIADNPNELSLTFNDTSGLIETFLYEPSPDYDPATGEGSVAVEFVTPSVTSANFDENLGVEASTIIGLVVNTAFGGFGNPNPHMKSKELNGHGYFIIDVNEDRAQADYFLGPIRQVTQSEVFQEGWLTNDADNHLTRATSASPPKPVQDDPAPLNPPQTSVSTDERFASNAIILSVYPNPFEAESTLNYSVSESTKVRIELLDLQGHVILVLQDREMAPGVHKLTSDLSDLSAGSYVYKVITDKGEQQASIVMKK